MSKIIFTKKKKLLHTPTFILKNQGPKSFSVAGPRIWNDLPVDLRKSSSLATFRKNLMTNLFKKISKWLSFQNFLIINILTLPLQIWWLKYFLKTDTNCKFDFVKFYWNSHITVKPNSSTYVLKKKKTLSKAVRECLKIKKQEVWFLLQQINTTMK